MHVECLLNKIAKHFGSREVSLTELQGLDKMIRYLL